MMMPCLRSTIASLGESGESQYSVAVLLGAIGAEQTLFSIIGPAVWPPVWAWTEGHSPALSFYIATVLTAGGIAACVALPPLEAVEAKASSKALAKLSLQGDDGERPQKTTFYFGVVWCGAVPCSHQLALPFLRSLCVCKVTIMIR
jgi:hypothetical protein